MHCSDPVTKTAWFLLLIGGLNWGLMGVGYFVDSNWNVVNLVLGGWPVVENIVYIVVGVSALWTAWKWTAGCKDCC